MESLSQRAAKRIDDAIALIEEKGWWDGAEGTLVAGRPTDTGVVCAGLAVSFGYEGQEHIIKIMDEADEALRALASLVPESPYSIDWDTVIEYNDRLGNKDEVLEWMRRAAELLRQESS